MPFGPNRAPPGTRGELLYPVVFSFRETVLGIEKPVVAGELLSAGNGATEPVLSSGRPAARLSPWMDLNRSIEDQRPRKKIPLRCAFSLRVPRAFAIPPAILYVFQFYVFLFRKRILVG